MLPSLQLLFYVTYRYDTISNGFWDILKIQSFQTFKSSAWNRSLKPWPHLKIPKLTLCNYYQTAAYHVWPSHVKLCIVFVLWVCPNRITRYESVKPEKKIIISSKAPALLRAERGAMWERIKAYEKDRWEISVVSMAGCDFTWTG